MAALAKVDPARQAEVHKWMEAVLGKKITGDFWEALKDGVLLCELVNAIKPGTCKKFKHTKIAFAARSNIQIYIDGAKVIGVAETDMFESRDLYDMQMPHKVLDNLYRLSAASHKVAGFKGPFISGAYAEKHERHFSPEKMKTSSAVPAWSRGGIARDKDGVSDGYGIVRVKGVDKHSGALSTWEKGSKAVDTSSKHDSYGIVKAKGMDKHSGALSTWEKGSKAVDTSSKHDSYGIVKAKGMDKHSGAMSTWDKGSTAHDTSAKSDAYGIVKGARD